MTLEQSLIAKSQPGVTVHHDLPGGWSAIVALHPAKVPYVDYLKHAPQTLWDYALGVARRWAE